jgi:hypothetical protein
MNATGRARNGGEKKQQPNQRRGGRPDESELGLRYGKDFFKSNPIETTKVHIHRKVSTVACFFYKECSSTERGWRIPFMFGRCEAV